MLGDAVHFIEQKIYRAVEALDPLDGEAVAGAVVNRCVGDEAEDVDAFQGVLQLVHHHAAEDVFGLVDAGSIYQDDLGVFAIEDALNAIAGGLRFRGDDGDFLADESIDECGFASVGAAYDCDETGLESHGLIDCTPLGDGEKAGGGGGRGSQRICHKGTETHRERREDSAQWARRKAEGGAISRKYPACGWQASPTLSSSG